MIQAFKPVQPNLTVVYPPTNSGGSGKGQTDLQAELVEFAGSDGVPKEAELPLYQGGALLYFPTVAGPITVSYNVSGVDKLKLDGDVIAKIFQGQITKWNDPAIADLNSGVDLPDADIVAVHRSDVVGHDRATSPSTSPWRRPTPGRSAPTRPSPGPAAKRPRATVASPTR